MRTGSPLPGVQEFLLTIQRWEGEKPRFHPALTVPSAGEALRLLRERTRKKRGWLGLGLLGVVEYLRGQRMQLGLQGTGGFRTGNPTKPQCRFIRAGRGLRSALSSLPEKTASRPQPHNDAKERKGAPRFDYLPCVPSLGTAFSNWVFDFVTDIAGL